MNLSHKLVSTEFLKFILNKGCKYLSLHNAICKGILTLDKTSQLRYLDLTKQCMVHVQVFEELLNSTHSLQKLSFMSFLYLTSNLTNSISYQNGKSLQVLNLAWIELSLESLKTIINSCEELKEVNC